MRSGPAPEIIEIIEVIDDDADWVTGRPITAQPAPDTGRRWIGPVAAATLAVAIGYGVISSAISSNSAEAPRATTTLPRPTTATTAIGAAQVVNGINPQYYVADPLPTGFIMQFAETLDVGGDPPDFTGSTTAQLWATDRATSTSGSWFLVSRGTHHFTGDNSYRTVVGNNTVAVEHDPLSDQARLSFNKDGDLLEVTAFGWTDPQLLRLVDSVYVSDSKIQFHDPFFVTDHKPMLYTDPSSALYGVPVAWVGYTTAAQASPAGSFTVTVADDPQSYRDVIIRFALTNAQPFNIGDAPGIVGQSATDPRLTIAQWLADDRLITMRGNIDAATLLSIAATVHAAPDVSVIQQVPVRVVDQSTGIQRPGLGVPVQRSRNGTIHRNRGRARPDLRARQSASVAGRRQAACQPQRPAVGRGRSERCRRQYGQ